MSEPTLEERLDTLERAVRQLCDGLDRVERVLAPYFDPEQYTSAKAPTWDVVPKGEKPN